MTPKLSPEVKQRRITMKKHPKHVETFPLVIHMKDQYIDTDNKSIDGVDRGQFIFRVAEVDLKKVTEYIRTLHVDETDYSDENQQRKVWGESPQ